MWKPKYKSTIKITQPQEATQLCEIPRRSLVFNYLYLFRINMNILTINSMAKIFNTLHTKRAFFLVSIESMVLQGRITCCRCSSQVLLKMRKSSKYTTTKELENGLGKKFLILINVVGAFVRPKGITNH